MKNTRILAIAAAAVMMLAAATAAAVDRSIEMQGNGITEALAGQAGYDRQERTPADGE